MTEELHLTQEWDKVFQKVIRLTTKKVTFHNHFGITLVAESFVHK